MGDTVSTLGVFSTPGDIVSTPGAYHDKCGEYHVYTTHTCFHKRYIGIVPLCHLAVIMTSYVNFAVDFGCITQKYAHVPNLSKMK